MRQRSARAHGFGTSGSDGTSGGGAGARLLVLQPVQTLALAQPLLAHPAALAGQHGARRHNRRTAAAAARGRALARLPARHARVARRSSGGSAAAAARSCSGCVIGTNAQARTRASARVANGGSTVASAGSMLVRSCVAGDSSISASANASASAGTDAGETALAVRLSGVGTGARPVCTSVRRSGGSSGTSAGADSGSLDLDEPSLLISTFIGVVAVRLGVVGLLRPLILVLVFILFIAVGVNLFGVVVAARAAPVQSAGRRRHAAAAAVAVALQHTVPAVTRAGATALLLPRLAPCRRGRCSDFLRISASGSSSSGSGGAGSSAGSATTGRDGVLGQTPPAAARARARFARL